MDTTDLKPLVEDLADNIDDLEESLAPLLDTALSASTSKLPLLDKAKLYVLATYAIESLLFSYLRINGVDAKNHAIFQELTRVKHYFDKLKTAETGPAKPAARLDRTAAGRFIKAGLAGNEDYDRQRRKLRDREKAGAKRKFEDMGERVGTHTRFETTAKKLKADDDETLAVEAPSENDDDDAVADDGDAKDDRSGKKKSKSRKKKSKLEAAEGSSPNPSNTETAKPRRQKSDKVPKGAGEAFQALLKAPKKEKKRKSYD